MAADLNLRNLPEELLKRLKVRAAERGVTLKQHCLDLLAIPEYVVRHYEQSAAPDAVQCKGCGKDMHSDSAFDVCWDCDPNAKMREPNWNDKQYEQPIVVRLPKVFRDATLQGHGDAIGKTLGHAETCKCLMCKPPKP